MPLISPCLKGTFATGLFNISALMFLSTIIKFGNIVFSELAVNTKKKGHLLLIMIPNTSNGD